MPKLFFLAVMFALISLPVSAAEYTQHEHVKARIIGVSGDDGANAHVDIVLADGWHTYGDPPGDAGLPPRLDWSASENIEEIMVTLPPTTRKREFDMFEVNAYKGQVLMPVNVTAKDEAEDVQLNLNLTIMICKNICIPEVFELSATLPKAAAAN